MSAAVASDRETQLVHVAILRRVRAGREAEFEAQIAAFFGEAAREPGMSGAYLIRPAAGSATGEYGVLRTFETEADMQHFYESDLYARWQKSIGPLVHGDARKLRLHGLEGFFRSDALPPTWKMAIVTWIGVNPAVYAVSKIVPGPLANLPFPVAFLVGNALVVVALTWVLMPILTRVLGRWLRS